MHRNLGPSAAQRKYSRTVVISHCVSPAARAHMPRPHTQTAVSERERARRRGRAPPRPTAALEPPPHSHTARSDIKRRDLGRVTVCVRHPGALPRPSLSGW